MDCGMTDAARAVKRLDGEDSARDAALGVAGQRFLSFRVGPLDALNPLLSAAPSAAGPIDLRC